MKSPQAGGRSGWQTCSSPCSTWWSGRGARYAGAPRGPQALGQREPVRSGAQAAGAACRGPVSFGTEARARSGLQHSGARCRRPECLATCSSRSSTWWSGRGGTLRRRTRGPQARARGGRPEAGHRLLAQRAAVLALRRGGRAAQRSGPPIQWRTLPAARVLGSVLRSAAVQDRGPPYGSADGPLVGIGTMSHPKARCSDRWRALPAARVLGNALSRRRNTPRGLLRRNARPFPEKTTELSGARFAARPGPVAEASDLASSRERASTPGRAR